MRYLQIPSHVLLLQLSISKVPMKLSELCESWVVPMVVEEEV